MSNPLLDIAIMYGLRMQSSENVYYVECRTERRSHIPIFKVCMLVND